jgi:uncharacterized protein (DUF362 family)
MNGKIQMHDHLYVIHGNDPFSVTIRLLEYLQPFKHLPAHAVIGIKPNLVTATPAGHGATTHPEIVEAVVTFLQAGGFSRIFWESVTVRQILSATCLAVRRHRKIYPRF